jgi:hypothetical protein
MSRPGMVLPQVSTLLIRVGFLQCQRPL